MSAYELLKNELEKWANSLIGESGSFAMIQVSVRVRICPHQQDCIMYFNYNSKCLIEEYRKSANNATKRNDINNIRSIWVAVGDDFRKVLGLNPVKSQSVG